MMQRTHFSIVMPLLTLVLWVVPGAGFANNAPSFRRQASDIINATGVRGGLVVQFGCGDGRLTAAMRAGDSWPLAQVIADAPAFV